MCQNRCIVLADMLQDCWVLLGIDFEKPLQQHVLGTILIENGQEARLSNRPGAQALPAEDGNWWRNKETGTKMLASDAIRDLVGDAVLFGETFELTLRGKTGKFGVHEVTGLAE